MNQWVARVQKICSLGGTPTPDSDGAPFGWSLALPNIRDLRLDEMCVHRASDSLARNHREPPQRRLHGSQSVHRSLSVRAHDECSYREEVTCLMYRRNARR